MSTKHTPGPWHVCREEGLWIAAYPLDYLRPAVRTIAHISDKSEPSEQDMADAQLIAAAPMLLEAARAMLDAFGGNVPDWLRDEAQALAAAVAAIDGEG